MKFRFLPVALFCCKRDCPYYSCWHMYEWIYIAFHIIILSMFVYLLSSSEWLEFLRLHKLIFRLSDTHTQHKSKTLTNKPILTIIVRMLVEELDPWYGVTFYKKVVGVL